MVAFVCTMLLVGVASLAGWLAVAADEAVAVWAVLVGLCVAAVVVALAVGCFRLIDILGMAYIGCDVRGWACGIWAD